MANDVNFQREEYKARLARWTLVRDAVKGEECIKAKGITYLPKPNPQDTTNEANDRYDQYKLRAVYYNATGRTKSALTGIAFAKGPEIELPAALSYLEEDADGSGVGLVNQAQGQVGELLETARCGLLVDYPTADAPTSLAQQAAGELRATIQVYPTEAIINWRSSKRGAKLVLDLVVLAETEEVWDGFERLEVAQRRVLLLSEDSIYSVEIYRQGEGGAWELIGEPMVPLGGNGLPLSEIPFQFVGASNNDALPDDAPLYDIAVINLAHYRNSADYEESVFFLGQPMYWMAGLDQAWVEMLEKKGIYVGSRALLPLPVNGSAGVLQAEPNTMAKEAMDAKWDMMGALGARLLQPGTVAKTATESSSDDKTSHSVLSLVCDNVSDAYRKALGWAAQFMNASGKVDFTIGTEFAGIQFDAQQMGQALAAVQSGKVPETDFWTYCRSIGLIEATKTDDEVRDELEAQAPPLVLDDPLNPGEKKPPVDEAA